jgi:hypothetical protein
MRTLPITVSGVSAFVLAYTVSIMDAFSARRMCVTNRETVHSYHAIMVIRPDGHIGDRCSQEAKTLSIEWCTTREHSKEVHGGRACLVTLRVAP